jgi:hypothetical protein
MSNWNLISAKYTTAENITRLAMEISTPNMDRTYTDAPVCRRKPAKPKLRNTQKVQQMKIQTALSLRDCQHPKVENPAPLLSVVGVEGMLDIMKTVLVAVCIHKLLISSHAFLFLRLGVFSARLGFDVVVVGAEPCTCVSVAVSISGKSRNCKTYRDQL